MVDYDDLLLKAVNAGDANEVRRLVAEGAQPGFPYDWGYPIFRACDLGLLDVIDMLVELGADVDVVNDARGGATPLASAVQGSMHLTAEQSLAVVTLLLRLKANPELPCGLPPGCSTALHFALSSHRTRTIRPSIVRQLLEHGANPYTKDRFGNDAFDYAAFFDAPDLLPLLAQSSPDISSSRINSAHKSTLLIKSAEDGNKEAVRRLVEEGVDLNKISPYGQDALFYAADKGDVNLIRFLLDHGADPNNLTGTTTALMTAAYRGHRAAFDALLNSGADLFASIEMAPEAYADALHFAEVGRHKELAAYIKQEMKRRSK